MLGRHSGRWRRRGRSRSWRRGQGDEGDDERKSAVDWICDLGLALEDIVLLAVVLDIG